jgi:hypothetical protein
LYTLRKGDSVVGCLQITKFQYCHLVQRLDEGLQVLESSCNGARLCIGRRLIAKLAIPNPESARSPFAGVRGSRAFFLSDLRFRNFLKESAQPASQRTASSSAYCRLSRSTKPCLSLVRRHNSFAVGRRSRVERAGPPHEAVRVFKDPQQMHSNRLPRSFHV